MTQLAIGVNRWYALCVAYLGSWEMQTLKNVTLLQWLGIVILFNTTLIGGASQLPDLGLGPIVVKAVLAAATLGNGFLGGLVTMFGGLGAQRDTVGRSGAIVVTNAANANALPDNPNVIAVTPAISDAIKKAQ